MVDLGVFVAIKTPKGHECWISILGVEGGGILCGGVKEHYNICARYRHGEAVLFSCTGECFCQSIS